MCSFRCICLLHCGQKSVNSTIYFYNVHLTFFYLFQKSSVSLVESTKFNVDPVPTGDYSKANDKQIWIAVSFGLAGVVLIIIIVITVFLVLKCRRNCKQERRGTYSCDDSLSVNKIIFIVPTTYSVHVHLNHEQHFYFHWLKQNKV